MQEVKISESLLKDFYHGIYNIFSRLCSNETKYFQDISKPLLKLFQTLISFTQIKSVYDWVQKIKCDALPDLEPFVQLK